MRAPGNRFKLYLRTGIETFDNLVSGECVLACVAAYFLLGAVGPIRDNWRVNLALVFGDSSVDYGGIGFINLTFLELATDVCLCFFVERDGHDARGIKIKPVNNPCAGPCLLEASNQAISVKKVFTRYT